MNLLTTAYNTIRGTDLPYTGGYEWIIPLGILLVFAGLTLLSRLQDTK